MHILQIGDFLTNMTLAIPKELHTKMKTRTELKWSDVARQAFEEKIKDLELLDDLKSIKKAELEFKKGKTISEKELAKKLGLKK